MAEVDCAIAAPLSSSTATKVASPGPSSPEDLVNITTALQSLGFDLEIICNVKPILGSTPSVALSFVNSGVRVSANSVSELSVSFNLQSARTAATVHNTANAGAPSISTPAHATRHATDTKKTEAKQPGISSSTSEPPALAPEESDAGASSESFDLAPSRMAAGISNAEAADQFTSAPPGANQAATSEPNPAPPVSASPAFAPLSKSHPVPGQYTTTANAASSKETLPVAEVPDTKNLQPSLCTCNNARVESCESSANSKVDARTKLSFPDEIQDLAKWAKDLSTIQRVLEEYIGSKRLSSPLSESPSQTTPSRRITQLTTAVHADSADSTYSLAADSNSTSHPSHPTNTAEAVTPSQSSAESFTLPPKSPPMTTGMFGASELSSASLPISSSTLTPLASQLSSWSSTPILALGRFTAPPPAVTRMRAISGKGKGKKKKTFHSSMRVGNNLHWQDVDFKPFIVSRYENVNDENINVSYEHISMMPENRGMSPEEIRVQAYKIQD